MKRTAIVALAFCLFNLSAFSQDADEIARELANPNTPLASLNFKNQFRFFDGDLPDASDQWSYTLLFQPTFPFALENGDQIIWRPAIPYLVDMPRPYVSDVKVTLPKSPGGTPVITPEIDYEKHTGLGDISFDLAYAKTTESGILTAIGLFTTLPTAYDSALGSGQWSLGPELLLGKISENYVIGIFPNHQWNVAGWGDNQVNLTSAQVFATWLPGGAWNIGTSPTLSHDWVSEQWTIPLNLSIGKTLIIGGTPWKISVEANYYVERPDAFSAEWMVGINIAPVVENVLANLFNL